MKGNKNHWHIRSANMNKPNSWVETEMTSNSGDWKMSEFYINIRNQNTHSNICLHFILNKKALTWIKISIFWSWWGFVYLIDPKSSCINKTNANVEYWPSDIIAFSATNFIEQKIYECLRHKWQQWKQRWKRCESIFLIFYWLIWNIKFSCWF